MRLNWILVFICFTSIYAIDLNPEDINEDDLLDEKLVEKRQIEVSATLVTDIGGTRYECPPNYRLEGNKCYHVDCIFENQPQVNCIIAATATFEQIPMPIRCEYGYDLIEGKCVKMITTFKCPPGTNMENNECVYRVPGPPTVYVDFRCPFGSVKDTASKTCIFTARVPSVAVQCPLGYQRIGDTCYYYMKVLSVRCPDGTSPINGYCNVPVPRANIKVECPPNTKSIGNNICELLPIDYTVRCGDGSAPDAFNRCYARAANYTVQRRCPPNSIEREGKCYVEARIKYPLPEVQYLCPRNFKQVGDACIMDIPSITAKFRCPENTYREGDACIYRVDDARNYNVTVQCPPGSRSAGNRCVAVYDGELGTCERIVQSKKCCRRKCGSGSSVTSIHNVNSVHVPTNITSVNIHNINIHQTSSCDQNKEETKVTERPEVPEEEMPEEKCCTVVTPRVCEHQDGDWNCGHREYRRCGDFCTHDTIHLKATRPVYNQRMLVMPPPQYGMRVHRRPNAKVNCYGCLNGRYNCSPECFEYDCAEEGCNLMEQETFCGEYGGEGCASADGYFNQGFF